MPAEYNWEVTFRNDKMGFQKRFWVKGFNYTQAMTKAIDQLRDHGYDPNELNVIRISRGKEVGTE